MVPKCSQNGCQKPSRSQQHVQIIYLARLLSPILRTDRSRGSRLVLGDPGPSTLALFRHPVNDHFRSKSEKTSSENVIRKRIEKTMIEMRCHFKLKCHENNAKIDDKINEQSVLCWNMRFLDFCKEYNVKIVFLQDQ